MALVFAGILLSSLLAEGLLRVLGSGPGPVARPVDEDAGGLPELHGMMDILKPNVRGSYKGRLYESNAFGFRGPNFPEKKGPDVFRIAIIGDSFTNGEGVRYEEAYPSLLSAFLNHEGDPRRYEVLNMGISGFNLSNSVNSLDIVGWRFSPDLVIYGFTLNDLEGEFYRKSTSPVARTWASPSRLINLLGNQYQYLRDAFWPAEGTYPWELDDNYFRNPEAWEAWVRDLSNLKRSTDRSRVCLGMFLHTQLQGMSLRYPFSRHYEAVRDEATNQQIPVIDSYPYFRGRREESLWVGVFDPHPNREGHEILAESLEDGLRALPPECWGGTIPFALQASSTTAR